MCLGNEIRNAEVMSYIETNKLYEQFSVSPITNDEIAQLLADGIIIARVVGRMEFGARALGNRSILANPSNQHIVKKINAQKIG